MRGNRKEPNPMSQLAQEKIPMEKKVDAIKETFGVDPNVSFGVGTTTQPMDEGKKSKKKKGSGKGGTILTSVTGVSGSPELAQPTLLGGSY